MGCPQAERQKGVNTSWTGEKCRVYIISVPLGLLQGLGQSWLCHDTILPNPCLHITEHLHNLWWKIITNRQGRGKQQFNLLLKSHILHSLLREISGQPHCRLNTCDEQLLKIKVQNSLKALIFFTKENMHQGHYFHC